MSSLMIYGATGYSGRLMVAEAVKAGLKPILAGRSPSKLAALALAHGVEMHVLHLHEQDLLARALQDISVVIHCAGPFAHTAMPMLEACLAAGTHYLDITGEIAVLETLAAQDARARDAGIMVLPGAGFDVVPSDCLAADLAARHPGGRILRIGLAAHSGVSRGTARTILACVDNFLIRRNGAITRVQAGRLRHDFDFGESPRTAVVGVLGDVATAYRSTGIANIETYVQATSAARTASWISRLLGRSLSSRPAQRLLNSLVDRRSEGPSPAERRKSYAIFVAEIEQASGERVAARLRACDPYGMTASVAVCMATRALEGDTSVGFQTPSMAYGPDLIRQFQGIEWDYL